MTVDREMIEEIRRLAQDRDFYGLPIPQLCDLAIKGLAGPPLPEIPKGWRLLPDSANIFMHNAAAKAHVEPHIEIGWDGKLRLAHFAPDWSRVYRVMVDAAPTYDGSPA